MVTFVVHQDDTDNFDWTKQKYCNKRKMPKYTQTLDPNADRSGSKV